MTGTAKLIARLTDENVIPCDRDLHHEVAAAIEAAEVRIRELEQEIGWLKDEIVAQDKEIDDLKSGMAGISIDRHYSRQEQAERAERAEARVRELEALHDVTLAACDTWRAELGAIEAKTIERCAQVAKELLPEIRIDDAIRQMAKRH